jgi:hypothetical protein
VLGARLDATLQADVALSRRRGPVSPPGSVVLHQAQRVNAQWLLLLQQHQLSDADGTNNDSSPFSFPTNAGLEA